IVLAAQAYHFVDPARPDNRAAFFTALFSLWWLFGLWGSLNLPALFGLAALAMLVAMVFVRTPQGASTWACAAFGVAMIVLAVAAVFSAGFSAGRAQLNARNPPLLLSRPLGLIALYAAAKPAVAARLPFRAAVMLSAWLAAASALWHLEATRRWS